MSSFSLSFCAIRPLAVVGTRGKAAQRIEAYAWVPTLWVFDKILEVGFLPTWILFPFLSVFPCFGWFVAVRGRLIGLKAWDRIDLNLLKPNIETVAVMGCLVF